MEDEKLSKPPPSPRMIPKGGASVTWWEKLLLIGICLILAGFAVWVYVALWHNVPN